MSEPGPPPRPTAEGIPPEGRLEELDGTPIRPPAPQRSAGAIPWHRAALAAVAVAAARPRLWAFALVAFLARGGIVVLALPIVVLPTFIGIANVVGPASVSAAGPSPRLVALIAVAVAVAAGLIVAGTIVAAAAETALHRATVMPDPGAPSASVDPARSFMVVDRPGGGRRTVAEVAGARLLLLIPVAVVTALAVPAWVAVAYRELTLPSDVATPLVVRVLSGAPTASLAVLLAWLAAELVGGFATRRIVLRGRSAPRALADGLVDPLRAPGGTLLTVLVALAGTVLALLPATWAVGAAWEMARRTLVDGAGFAEALGACLLLTAAWIAALLLAGGAAAGRATLLTAELLRRGEARAPRAVATTGSPFDLERHVAAEPPVG